jgi:outer membrane protein assembly factor BamB
MTWRFLIASCSCLAAVSFQPTTTSGQTGRDWPQWRGANRDGIAAFTAPTTWPATLTKRWELVVGAGHSSPVVSGNRVIIHTRQNEREITRAIDLAKGAELWRQEHPVPYVMNPAARAHGPGPKSTPAMADGRVFTFGISGILTAHDLATGKVLWRNDAPPAPPEFGTALSPIVDGTQVIVHLGANDEGALTAFDVASGKPRWRWTGDGPAYSSPVIASIGGTRQLVTQSENAVIGVDASSGTLLWRIPFRTNFDQNSVTPIVIGDIVVYSGLENGTAAVRVSRKASEWVADPVWKNPQISMYMSSPVVVDGTIYGLSHRNRGQFFALDAGSGRTLWTTPGREGENASIVASGQLLFLSTTNGEVIVIRANARAYEELKRYRVAESAVWAHPAVFGSTILVKDLDKLICWTL